ncbi:hypothetical protein BHM03_00061703 [Ensete ventricosum]|nr:hypothetical protein BHM03_00061703 [Ensete ventricosum]
MDKRSQMSFFRHMLITARKEVRKAFKDDIKTKQYLQIINYLKNFTNKIIFLAAYYLNLIIQFRYSLGTRSDLLSALRNIIYQLLSNTIVAVDAIMEGQLFQKIICSFSDVVTVSCRYNMDPIKWWLQFEGDAPSLRTVVVHVLSQTMTSSGVNVIGQCSY